MRKLKILGVAFLVLLGLSENSTSAIFSGVIFKQDKLNSTGAAILAVASIKIFTALKSDLDDREFTPLSDEYWGPSSKKYEPEDPNIYAFSINITDKALDNLRSKLKEELSSGRFAEPLEGIGFQYGFNTKYLQEVGSYWLEKYDWRGREKLLNEIPAFKTKVSGLNLFFQRAKSKEIGKYKRTRPLLILHGWPGSIVEYQKMIPFLTDPVDSEVAFEVIIPSLPGYGFSDAARKPGLGPVRMAQIMIKLMERLGYERFYVQGGDLGSIVVAVMAALYPQKIIGLHSNLCISLHPRAILKMLLSTVVPSLYFTPEERERFQPMDKNFVLYMRESGYAHIQATKPDTVGMGLSHSPLGLAAYILEKFSTGTNPKGVEEPDGGLTSKIPMDELLDNIMIYWLTNSITTSMRFYHETFALEDGTFEVERLPVKVPSACIVPRYESIIIQSKSMVRETYRNLISYVYTSDGGHFFSMEYPDFMAKNFISFAQIVEERFKPD